ncbi:hypothetical protein LTR17_021617 [Elasticomyces elasticus]|nr:hypothetical protein LTR17_021617 [Elasticomyces elasticus]
MESSPFGKLSAELRVAIYELVISQPTAVTMRHDDVRRSFSPDAGHGADADMFAMTRVCRIFTKETAGLVYKRNVLRFEVTNVKNPFAELDRFESLLSTEDAQHLRPVLVLPLALHTGIIVFHAPGQEPYGPRVHDSSLLQCLEALLTRASGKSCRPLRVQLDCGIVYKGHEKESGSKVDLSLDLDFQKFTGIVRDELTSPFGTDDLFMTWRDHQLAELLCQLNEELYGFLEHFGASKAFLKEHHRTVKASH